MHVASLEEVKCFQSLGEPWLLKWQRKKPWVRGMPQTYHTFPSHHGASRTGWSLLGPGPMLGPKSAKIPSEGWRGR